MILIDPNTKWHSLTLIDTDESMTKTVQSTSDSDPLQNDDRSPGHESPRQAACLQNGFGVWQTWHDDART